MTNEGFDYLYKLTKLNKISFENDNDDDDDIFNDINLSPNIIDKFLNISEFQSDVNIIPVDGVKGFLYILDLRKQREEEGKEKDKKKKNKKNNYNNNNNNNNNSVYK